MKMAQKVLNRIDNLTNQYPDAEFSFGHIVLSDYNLGKQHIRYCLRDDVIWGWVEQQRKDGNMHNDVIFRTAAEVIDLLTSLLSYPEHVLEDAECIYHGDEVIE